MVRAAIDFESRRTGCVRDLHGRGGDLSGRIYVSCAGRKNGGDPRDICGRNGGGMEMLSLLQPFDDRSVALRREFGVQTMRHVWPAQGTRVGHCHTARDGTRTGTHIQRVDECFVQEMRESLAHA